jgi:hypothetical protein
MVAGSGHEITIAADLGGDGDLVAGDHAGVGVGDRPVQLGRDMERPRGQCRSVWAP